MREMARHRCSCRFTDRQEQVARRTIGGLRFGPRNSPRPRRGRRQAPVRRGRSDWRLGCGRRDCRCGRCRGHRRSGAGRWLCRRCICGLTPGFAQELDQRPFICANGAFDTVLADKAPHLQHSHGAAHQHGDAQKTNVNARSQRCHRLIERWVVAPHGGARVKQHRAPGAPHAVQGCDHSFKRRAQRRNVGMDRCGACDAHVASAVAQFNRDVGVCVQQSVWAEGAHPRR